MLCRRALLPSTDTPLLLYEEIRVGELRRLKNLDDPIRSCFSDSPDAPILVYQVLPVSGPSKAIPELLHSEFCELHFPWNLLAPIDSSSDFKQCAVVLPPKADNCLLPGIPFANRTSFASNALFATMSGKSPSFTVRLSLKNSCRYLLHLLASHLNTEPQFIQLFKPIYLGSGDKEFVAIPSAFLGTLQGLLSVAGSANSCSLHHNHHTPAL
ncbi:unnamed protein product, partial [Dibothriocephalus latus]